MMKNIKIFVLVFACCVTISMHAMKPSAEFSIKSRRAVPVRYKSDIVWVKTSDNVVMELAQWQVDQMKALQQMDENSKNNPADASMINSDDLALIQKALQSASDLGEFKFFCTTLSEDQQISLIAGAFTLEMQGLASLLLTYIFPKEVQAQMGASIIQPAGIITPVVEHLQSAEKIVLSHKGPLRCIACSPDGKRIICGSAGIDHNLILYDLQTDKEIKNLHSGNFPVSCVAFSPDGEYIIAGAGRLFENLILWNGKTGKQIKIFNYFEGRHVSCVAFSPDGKYMVVGLDQKTGKNNLILLNAQTWDVIQSFQGPLASDGSYMTISSAAFAPNGEHIIVGSSEYHHVMVCDAKSGAIIKTFDGLSKGTICVAVSSDGKYMAAGSSHQERLLYHSTCLLWNLETGTLIKDMEFGLPVSCIAFSPDGYYVVAGSWLVRGHPLHVCNGRTGEKIKSVLDLFTGQVADVAFSPDSGDLFCASKEGLVEFNMIKPETLKIIATQLNIAQAGFLYRLYVANMNNVRVILDEKELDYQLFKTLPVDVQKIVKVFLPFELVSDVVKKIKRERAVAIKKVTEKEIQEKMNEYRSSLFSQRSLFFSGTYQKRLDEKIKAVKGAMQKLDKDSIDYKACERLLIELEQETAFK